MTRKSVGASRDLWASPDRGQRPGTPLADQIFVRQLLRRLEPSLYDRN